MWKKCDKTYFMTYIEALSLMQPPYEQLAKLGHGIAIARLKSQYLCMGHALKWDNGNLLAIII